MALNNTSQHISSLYDYKPAYKNLYKIEILGDEDRSISDYCLLHATQVTFNGETLTLQRNPVTKQFTLPGKTEAFKLADDLRITWRENDLWKVRQFHQAWLNRFYDRSRDCYICGPEGKSKTFLITLPGNIRIQFNGVYPKSAGNVDLQWSTQGGIITHGLDYYVTSWTWTNVPNEEKQGIVL